LSRSAAKAAGRHSRNMMKIETEIVETLLRYMNDGTLEMTIMTHEAIDHIDDLFTQYETNEPPLISDGSVQLSDASQRKRWRNLFADAG